MCLFRKGPTLMPTPARIDTSVDNQLAGKGSRLPEDKDLLDEQVDATNIDWGTKKDKSMKGKTTGASDLTIGLNTGTQGQGSGGINV